MSVSGWALPGMATLVADAGQWRIDAVQLVNWGGFHGWHRAPLDVDTTLLTGATGTGKSTVLDSYIALMMDSNEAFNTASNDNVTGRARSSDQRNVLSYVRGKIDTSRDPRSGRMRDEVLRGSGGTTWSAIAMTWSHDTGQQLTAMRLYHAPASATASRDVRVHMAVVPADFDVRRLEPFAAENFHHGRVVARFPEVTFFRSYTEFSATLHKRLGIGRHGDGSQALKLLARIQGGRAVSSVDGLFKDMVLEEPGTFAAADRALEHFTELASSHETMRTAEQQVDTLRSVADLHRKLQRVTEDADLIDTFGLARPAHEATPLRVWSLQREVELIAGEVTANRLQVEQQRADRDEVRATLADVEQKVEENRRQQEANGGGALKAVEQEFADLGQNLDAAEAARTRFTDRTGALGAEPAGENDFRALRAAAEEFLAGHEQRSRDLADQLTGNAKSAGPLQDEQQSLTEDLAYLRQRDDLVPRRLHQTRLAIAAHLGLSAEQLPFVAELIDLAPEHERWREAAELLLGGFARTLLVDAAEGREFRTQLDSLRLETRINFQLVAVDQPLRDLDDHQLPGRLVFRDGSPFVGWLQEELEDRFDHDCVDDATAFADDGRRRITLSGQVQNGSRGAHGGHGQQQILGFSSTRRIEHVQQRLQEVLEELAALARIEQELRTAQRRLSDERDAHRFVLDTTWAAIDVATARAAVEECAQRREKLLATSDVLTELRIQQDRLETELKAVRKQESSLDITIEGLDEVWSRLLEREDEVKDALERAAADAGPDPQQSQRLEVEYQRFATAGTHQEFGQVLAKIRTSLGEQVAAAREQVRTHTEALQAAFRSFQQRWPRPNLGTGVSSYAGYQQILDNLLAEGLPERKEAFTERVVQWSGEDLLSLHRAFSEAVEEIEDRLVPVNEILDGLEFGPGRDRLHITLRAIRGDDIKRFRRDLKDMASNTTRLVTPEEVEKRFEYLRRFMDRIRKVPGSEREHLLDVRRHVHIEAERLHPTTSAQLGVYDQLSGKSGGESQELIAFIVGAALRYQLGDEGQPRPSYAPVFLDEGFVKSDAEFTGRAMQAWRGLGFQLIIGTPLDKVAAVEPYSDRVLAVTKTRAGMSSVRVLTPDDLTDEVARHTTTA